jgi:CDP-4-dehydro-6-deoxyglucose reductase
MALLPWIQGTVVKILEEARDTRRFFIRVEGTENFEFKPGQFVTLDLPIHEKPNKRWRSYSIASAPDGTGEFELIIVLSKDGLGTNYLFNEIREGSVLTMRGPQGVFILKEEQLAEDLFLICTGTGIAPFRSMIRHIFNKGIPFKNIHLVFGCRTREDLLYHEELTKLQSEKGFHYHPTLSREKWEGHTGYVHAVYEELCEERPAASFFLCGWKGMIDEARERIQAMGYDKKQIHFEIYG